MHSLEVFAAKVYIKKTLKGNNLAELRWDISLEDLKNRDSRMRVQMWKTEIRNKYLRKCH